MQTNILSQTFTDQARGYIDLLDELNAHGLGDEIPTPKIAFIGDQSSGKSSTLENLSGVNLPKGTGTVTRAALELQLRSPTRSEGVGARVWLNLCSNEQKPDNCPTYENPKIIQESQVSQTIESLTEQMTGGNDDGFTKHTIVVRIVRQGLHALTLIDLPGMIRLGEGNEQKLVEDLITHYVKQEEVIILPIVPCNVDLDTSACLKLATEYDPSGKRTIPVLTKVDRIESGAEDTWFKVLQQGYHKCENITHWHMVKNRSQQQLDEAITLEAATKLETRFFKDKEPWSELENDSCFGVSNLAAKLSNLQISQIKKFLPSIKEKSEQKLDHTKKKLKAFGEVIPDDKDAQIQMTLAVINDLQKLLEKELEQNEGEFWAVLHSEFEKFREKLNLTKQKFNGQYVAKLKVEIKKRRGRELPLFPSFPLARKEIKEILSEWEDIFVDLTKTTAKHIEGLLTQLQKKVLGKFPRLAALVNPVLSDLVQKSRASVEQLALQQLKSMIDDPYTQNDYFEETALNKIMDSFQIPDDASINAKFSGYGASIATATAKAFCTQLIQKVRASVNPQEFPAIQLSAIIQAYWRTCYKRASDEIPSLVLFHMKSQVVKETEKALIQIVVRRRNSVDDLLRLQPGIAEKRKKCQETVQCLEKCMQIMNERMI